LGLLFYFRKCEYLLCTGFSEKIDENAAKAIGTAGYIEKPFGKRDFAFKVRKVLEGK